VARLTFCLGGFPCMALSNAIQLLKPMSMRLLLGRSRSEP